MCGEEPGYEAKRFYMGHTNDYHIWAFNWQKGVASELHSNPVWQNSCCKLHHIMTYDDNIHMLWMSFISCRWANVMLHRINYLQTSFLSQGQYIHCTKRRGLWARWGNSCMPVNTTTCYTDRHNKTCMVTRYATGQDTTLSGSYGGYIASATLLYLFRTRYSRS